MEIPVIESGISRFQSPNLLFHLRTLSTWLALIVAAVATFSSLVRRLKRVILRFRKGRSVISPPPSRTFYDTDDDVSCSSSDDEDGDEAAAAEEDEDEEEPNSESEKDFGDLEDEIRGQNGDCEQHFDWPELARGGGSVVKLWDELGLRRSKGLISLLDLSRDEAVRSFLWERDEIPAVHVASPQTFVLAGDGRLEVWDSRAADVAATNTWQEEGLGRLVGILGGGDRNEVRIGNDVGKLRVVDLRNVRSPLAEMWWSGGGGCGGDGLVSWCRNAARSLTRL